MSRCEADKHKGGSFNFYFLPGGGKPIYMGARCTFPAVVELASGCLHEHVVTWHACTECAERALSQLADHKRASCPACRALPVQPHEGCPVMLSIHEPAEATA